MYSNEYRYPGGYRSGTGGIGVPEKNPGSFLSTGTMRPGEGLLCGLRFLLVRRPEPPPAGVSEYCRSTGAEFRHRDFSLAILKANARLIPFLSLRPEKDGLDRYVCSLYCVCVYEG